jgi:DNA-binding response OmpR family regulator
MARVLVIDDHTEIRELLRLTLQAAGYDVAVAPNGREGLEIHRERPAELVITDIFMPEQEGLETIQELRRQSPSPKIIAMSGGGSLGTLEYLPAAKEFGADHAIGKPFDCETMVAAVREMLGAAG